MVYERPQDSTSANSEEFIKNPPLNSYLVSKDSINEINEPPVINNGLEKIAIVFNKNATI